MMSKSGCKIIQDDHYILTSAWPVFKAKETSAYAADDVRKLRDLILRQTHQNFLPDKK